MGLFYSVRNSNSQPSVTGTGQFLRNQVGLDIREDQVYYRQRDTRFDSGSYLVLVPNIPDLGIKSASPLVGLESLGTVTRQGSGTSLGSVTRLGSVTCTPFDVDFSKYKIPSRYL